MLSQDCLNIFDRELVHGGDFGARTERWRHDPARFVLVVGLDDDPRFVISVLAPPIGVSHPMRTALLKDIDNPRARKLFGLVRDFNEKACHGFSLVAEEGRWNGTSRAWKDYRSPATGKRALRGLSEIRI